MPDVEIRNNTDIPLRIAIIFCAPIHFDNHVTPGNSLKAHVGSFFFTFEARSVENGNEYSMGDSLARAGMITGAVAAGTASVLMGAVGGIFGWGASASLMQGAHAEMIDELSVDRLSHTMNKQVLGVCHNLSEGGVRADIAAETRAHRAERTVQRSCLFPPHNLRGIGIRFGSLN
ncbi:hypothetical protein SERLA73DRAFT_161412 [Serpula lacrymans var. lacrymans S7.3]|uniref:Uncharacterized protein n=1 Tax=Serpula lacrymans var. lacrymans (strain S7.3) TaxID=936435 RepID=F8Q299_SERL3|nr:hypothetical protein SERLA73DRAFT_161412 [Serpula lacrymans var. lacrymans S7.3]